MTEVKIPKELAEKATDCAEERGFENIENLSKKRFGIQLTLIAY